ncbi:MAG: hypothetical protein ACFE0Q_06815 [Anaerolineae bacterium]
MLRRLWGDIPAWADPQHNPLLRYEYVRQQTGTSSAVWRVLGAVLSLSLLILIGYAYSVLGFPNTSQAPYPLMLWRALIVPLIIVQVFTRALATAFAFYIVPAERQRQTWDDRRATLNGASLSIYSWWLALLWRVRNLFIVGLVGRGLLLLGICYEVTRLHGAYLDLLTARAIPAVPFLGGILLLSAFLTGLIVLPLLLTGVDVALALWLSLWVRNRTLLSILQTLIVSGQILLTLGLSALSLQVITQDMPSGIYGTLIIGTSTLFADGGLMLAQLTQAGELWARLPYGILIGGVMIVWALMQIALIRTILRSAVQIAETGE